MNLFQAKVPSILTGIAALTLADARPVRAAQEEGATLWRNDFAAAPALPNIQQNQDLPRRVTNHLGSYDFNNHAKNNLKGFSHLAETLVQGDELARETRNELYFKLQRFSGADQRSFIKHLAQAAESMAAEKNQENANSPHVKELAGYAWALRILGKNQSEISRQLEPEALLRNPFFLSPEQSMYAACSYIMAGLVQNEGCTLPDGSPLDVLGFLQSQESGKPLSLASPVIILLSPEDKNTAALPLDKVSEAVVAQGQLVLPLTVTNGDKAIQALWDMCNTLQGRSGEKLLKPNVLVVAHGQYKNPDETPHILLDSSKGTQGIMTARGDCERLTELMREFGGHLVLASCGSGDWQSIWPEGFLVEAERIPGKAFRLTLCEGDAIIDERITRHQDEIQAYFGDRHGNSRTKTRVFESLGQASPW